MTSQNDRKKIWVAISTPFQVNFFHYLMKRLQDKIDFLVTAREHDKIIPMLEAKNIEFITVGKHGGKELQGKLWSYADTIQQMIPIVQQEKPDLLLTERWPEAVRTAFGFNIPSWTIFYDEREFHVNWMTFPLASKIFAPSFYSPDDLREQGVSDMNKVIWFDGFHTCYLKDFTVNQSFNPFVEMGLDHPIVLIRPEPEFAAFFQTHRRKVLEETVQILSEQTDANLVVFPRNEDQMHRYSPNDVNIFDDVTVDCPVAYADVTLGAAETMLMESFVLGTPTISAVYWKPAKPVTELHKYIPHFTNPKELAKQTIAFFDSEINNRFREKAKSTVDRMENPVEKMVLEINKMFGFSSSGKKTPRRSRFEILAEILQSISYQSLIFSHIMQRVNITHRELRNDLRILEKNLLLERIAGNGSRIHYRTTKKGLQTLEEFRQLANAFDL